MESRAGTVRFALPGIRPSQGPQYPTAPPARTLTPASPLAPGCRGRPQPAHSRLPWATNPSLPHRQANLHPTIADLWWYSQRFPVPQAGGQWGLEQKQEPKCSQEHLCKSSWIHLRPPVLPNGTKMTATKHATWIHNSFFFSDHWENNCFICRDQQSGRSSRKIHRVCFIFPLEFIRCGQVRSQQWNHEEKMGHSCKQNPSPTLLQAHFMILKVAESILSISNKRLNLMSCLLIFAKICVVEGQSDFQK